MKIETQHILVHIIYPVNIPKVRHLIISTPYYRFSEYLRCSIYLEYNKIFILFNTSMHEW